MNDTINELVKELKPTKDLTSEEASTIAVHLLGQVHLVNKLVQEGHDYHAEVLKMLETGVILLGEEEKDEVTEDVEVVHELAKLPFAVLQDSNIRFNGQKKSIDESFNPIQTFDTLIEAIEYAEENDKNIVVKIDWDNNHYSLSYLKEKDPI